MQKVETKNKMSSVDGINNTQILVEKKETPLHTFGTTIFTSIRVGTFGFAIVFSIIIIMKLLAFSIGTKEFFVLNLNDIIIAFWGFIVLSFSKYISFHKK